VRQNPKTAVGGCHEDDSALRAGLRRGWGVVTGGRYVLSSLAAARARSSDIHQDLAGYDTQFGLPPVAIQVDAGLVGPSADPALATGEEVEDTELLHAIAPRARIRILLVNLRAGAGNAALEGYGVALRYAIA
jgi:hypothetical protein